jgi:hypothetical protein
MSEMRKQLLNEKKHESVIHMLEDAVLLLEQSGETEQEIHSMVAMILRGFLVNGKLTEGYIELARQAQEFQAAEAERQQQKFGSSLGSNIVGASNPSTRL